MCERIPTVKRKPGCPHPRFVSSEIRRSFPSRQLLARRCISGSQLTIIGGYRGRVKSVPVAWSARFGPFDAIRKGPARVPLTRTQMSDFVPRVQTKSPAAVCSDRIRHAPRSLSNDRVVSCRATISSNRMLYIVSRGRDENIFVTIYTNDKSHLVCQVLWKSI